MRRGALLAVVCCLAIVACVAPKSKASRPDSAAARSTTSTRDSVLRLGDSIYRQSPDSARRIWTVALETARAAYDSVGEARALTGLGQAARQLGDFTASRRLGEQGLALKLRLGMSHDLFRSYNSLGLLAWNQERLDEATSLFARATAAAATDHDSIDAVKATMNSGLVAADLAAFDRARSLLERARLGAESTHDSATLARTLNNLAALDVTLGDPIAAIDALETARRIARLIGDAATEVNARGQLATAYDALGEPQRAFALFDSAITMARRDGRRVEVAEDLGLMAGLFLDAGDFTHALDYYQRSLAATDSLGQPEERGNILRNEARAYAALDNVALAVERGTEARRVHHASRLSYPELADVIVLASLTRQRGHAADAKTLLDTARAIATKLQAPIAGAYVSIAEAQIAAQSREWSRVLSAIGGARASLSLLGSGAEATALSLEARADAQLGHTDAALIAGRRAIAAVERVRGHYVSGELRTTYASQQADVYAAQVLLLLRVNRIDEAFQVADAARGRGLLDHLASARADIRAARDSSGAFEAEALLRRIDALVSKLQQGEARPPEERSTSSVALSRELGDSLVAARAEYEALVARAAPVAALFTASDIRTSVPSLTRSFRPGEALLEYLVLDDRVLIFALTSTGLTVRGTDEGAASLAARVQLARELLQRREDAASARRVLSALYDILIKPVEASGVLRDATRLIVVPHGPLVYLPFSALVDPQSGRYAAERYSILKLATAASLPWLRRSASTEIAARARSARVAQIFAPFPDRLPSTRNEATEIARLFASSRIYLGAEATKANLKSALESGALVHVATHANMNARNPLFSQLDLAGGGPGPGNNGRLEVHELLAYRVASPLVFLSGCETALGAAWSTRFDTGEDYTTIAQTLLYAGAGNVVATLWRIDDAGAAAFATRFYRSLGPDGVAAGLAQAQRAMLADPRYRSPYYWAAYEATGSGILSGEGPRKFDVSVR